MSIRAVSWVWTSSPIQDPAYLLLMLALADSAGNEAGDVVPDLAVLALKCRRSPELVSGMLANLVKHGQLRHRREDLMGRGIEDVYTVVIPDGH